MVTTGQLKIYVVHDDAVVARTVADFLGDLETRRCRCVPPRTWRPAWKPTHGKRPRR